MRPVRLSTTAELDFANIVKWTAEKFGPEQARRYAAVLIEAIGELAAGPEIPGARQRDELMKGLWSIHIAHRKRRGRHFLLYRCLGDGTIEIGRILHDQMELARHLPPDTSDLLD